MNVPQSVVDWLLSGESATWRVAEAEGHAVHTGTWGRKIRSLSLQEDGKSALQALGMYAVRHALAHALESGRSGSWEAAHAVCTSLAYVKACATAGELGRMLRLVAQCRKGMGSALEDVQRQDVKDTLGWLR